MVLSQTKSIYEIEIFRSFLAFVFSIAATMHNLSRADWPKKFAFDSPFIEFRATRPSVRSCWPSMRAALRKKETEMDASERIVNENESFMKCIIV